ncbi:MAG: type II toxin-antitoxin system VapC family toxin [Dehalococcoidia bacterium]
MAGSFLLDTGIVAALFRGDAEVARRIEEADELYLSVVALGELYYGAFHSAQQEKEEQQVADFAVAAQLLLCDMGTAETYGRIKTKLRAKGRPIPENDIWIAAVAMQHDLTLAHRDAHFDEIDGLKRAPW